MAKWNDYQTESQGNPLPEWFLKRQHPVKHKVKQMWSLPWMTCLLIGINVVVYLLEFMASHSFNISQSVLLAYGARSNILINQGQWWRFLTPMFVHLTLFHIGSNMIALYPVGVILEQRLGHLKLGATYLLAGLTGNIASYFFSPATIAAGASTSIFGLFMATVMLRYTDHGDFNSLAVSRSVLGIIGYNLMFNLLVPGIDIAGHIGGLIGGAIGSLCWLPNPNHSIFKTIWGLVAGAIIILGTIAFLAGEIN